MLFIVQFVVINLFIYLFVVLHGCILSSEFLWRGCLISYSLAVYSFILSAQLQSDYKS